ncbi:MAG: CpaD family pilus assembly protein [Parasphingorhabdus sp.]|nr:CpaD family pilus assembly protein [Parasphingorhabdus sp.]
MRIVSLALISALGLSVSACESGTANRSLDSVNQPVVERSNYILDLNLAGSGTLPAGEQRRLSDWFEAMNLGYGDRVSIDDPAYNGSGSARDIVANLAAPYGILVSETAPVTGGNVPPGALRVVISRSVAYVPNCPNWSHHSHTDYQARTSENYGCATNSNLAAMIADPEDLVRGQSAGVDNPGSGSKAIKAYRDKPSVAGVTAGGGIKQ